MTGLANHPTTADLERLPIAAIASLPADQLVLLQDEVEALLDHPTAPSASIWRRV